jgi:hypothetical protein
MIFLRPQVVPLVFLYGPSHILLKSVLGFILGLILFRVTLVDNSRDGRILSTWSAKWGGFKWILDSCDLSDIELLIFVIIDRKTRRTKRIGVYKH